MKKNELVDRNLIIYESASIEEAMVAITDNQRGAIVVVDGNFTFRGVVSDGDIRRAMVHGALPLTPLSKIVNINAVTLQLKDRSRAVKVFNETPGITLLPVIDNKNKVVDVAVLNNGQRK